MQERMCLRRSSERYGFQLIQDALRFTDTNEVFPHSVTMLPAGIDLGVVEPFNPVLSRDIDQTELWLQHIIQDQLREDLRTTPMLLVEPPIESREHRLRLVETVFEKFGACAFTLCKSALLTSYLCSKDHSFVVDIGAHYTYITPVYEGFVVSKAAIRVEKAGNFLTEKFHENLTQKLGTGLKLPNIKHPGIVPGHPLWNKAAVELVDDIKSAVCKVHETSTKSLFFNKVVDNKTYDLPDDQTISIGREYYDVPELLFRPADSDPEGLSLQRMIAMAKEKIPYDKRKDILSNIVLSGGTSNMPGLSDRLQKELNESGDEASHFGKIRR